MTTHFQHLWCDRRHIKAFFSLLELEESKGGKGRDSGECDPLLEDGEGDEGSGGQRATDTNPPQPGGLWWRQEVLPAEDQPLHQQQEQNPDGAFRGECGPGFATTSSAPDPPRTHLWSTDAHSSLWLDYVSSTLAPAARHRTPAPHSHPHPGAVLTPLTEHQRSCVETVAPGMSQAFL